MMKLWLLTRIESPDYDETGGFVIRAQDEERARAIATERDRTEVWLDPDQTTCVSITGKYGREGVLLRDFNAG